VIIIICIILLLSWWSRFGTRTPAPFSEALRSRGSCCVNPVSSRSSSVRVIYQNRRQLGCLPLYLHLYLYLYLCICICECRGIWRYTIYTHIYIWLGERVCVYIATTVLLTQRLKRFGGRFFRRTILSNLRTGSTRSRCQTATRFQFSFTRRRRQSADNNKPTTTILIIKFIWKKHKNNDSLGP